MIKNYKFEINCNKKDSLKDNEAYTIKRNNDQLESIRISHDKVSIVEIKDILNNNTLIYLLEYNQITLEEALSLPKDSVVNFPKDIKELNNPCGNTTIYTSYNDEIRIVVSNSDGTTTSYDVDKDDIQLYDNKNYQLNLKNRIINYSNDSFVDTNPNPDNRFLISEIKDVLSIN